MLKLKQKKKIHALLIASYVLITYHSNMKRCSRTFQKPSSLHVLKYSAFFAEGLRGS